MTRRTDLKNLAKAIEEYETTLPGWWWSIGECKLGGHASGGPDLEGPDADLLRLKDRTFDNGFHRDTNQGTAATALRKVMAEGKAARELQRRKENDGHEDEAKPV